MVKPFRVKESPVQFECIVNEILPLGSEGGAGNLIICEVIKFHIDEAVLDEKGLIDPIKIDLVSRMGANWYSRAKEGLFEVEKPHSFRYCEGVFFVIFLKKLLKFVIF